jgi:hypothetical protein
MSIREMKMQKMNKMHMERMKAKEKRPRNGPMHH